MKPFLSSLRPLPALALALLLGACAATPPEAPPRLALPAAYAPSADWQPAPPPQASGAWWTVFGDARLDALEAEVAAHNQTLAAQLASYQQAQAALAQAQAAYWPTLNASAGVTRSRAGNASVQAGSIGSSDSVGATASWTPDLWGKVRLQVQAGAASAQASAATLQGTLLSLQGTLAQSYLQLRTVDAQIVLARDTLAAYARALELTENTYKAGVDTAADVAQARTQWLAAQTSLTDLGVTRAQLQDAIAVLVGQPASSFVLAADPTLPEVPELPPGLPAQLLLRRPDLVAAQAQVAAANAQIGVAQSAWFPDLTLGAQGSSTAVRLAELFSAPSLVWSIGPQLAATLFDGGLRSAQLQASRAAYQQTVANYRGAALSALQQVEDELAAQRILAQEAAQQAEVVQAAGVSLRLAENQYKAGTAPYLNVIAAQNVETGARNAALSLRERRYTAAVGLIQALGGGWDGLPVAAPDVAAAALAKPAQ
jgi:NodT family efflux transporter outer membrane factor (OMF) lipoprotein